jgi:GNAT superfamily N-acetyltransferase
VRVAVAEEGDFAAWLDLAAQVEHLFGPMVSDPRFHQALARNIARGTAFCVRQDDDRPGSPLLGGLLFSPHPPLYILGWLAVAEGQRRRGIGGLLTEHALSLIEPPADVMVTTFGPGNPAGEPARAFYLEMGFRPAEMVEDGPEGGTRQVFRRAVPLAAQ